MNGECKQVQEEQHEGQGLFSMTEIVIDLVALVFQGIEGFIFYFSSASACFCQLFNVLGCNREVSDPRVCVAHFSVLVDQLIGEPV